MSRNLLVVGGAGYIGSHVSKCLAARGDRRSCSTICPGATGMR